jgi:SAM-dependent methyltransferase
MVVMSRADLPMVDEPLAESAPLAWEKAPALCWRDPETGVGCEAYHRAWQYRRLLGLITTVGTDGDFLLERFSSLARGGAHRRVLVAGTADYGMLAHLAAAYRSEGAPLEVTVVDRCATPLMLNRWYGERRSLPVETLQANLLDLPIGRAFDLVCTHSLFGRLTKEDRERVVGAWHAQLRPGGLVLTTQRIRPGAATSVLVLDENAARAVGAAAENAARAFPVPGPSPEELGRVVAEEVRGRVSHLLRAQEEALDPFVRQGFTIEEARVPDADQRGRDRPASLAGSDSHRLQIVARRV